MGNYETETELDSNMIVLLDVGGVLYKTTVGTLTGIQESVLAFLVTTPLRNGLALRAAQARQKEKKEKDNDQSDSTSNATQLKIYDPLLEPIFIDRDGESFRHILNYLRNRSLPLQYMSMSERSTLLEEAKYYNVRKMKDRAYFIHSIA